MNIEEQKLKLAEKHIDDDTTENWREELRKIVLSRRMFIILFCIVGVIVLKVGLNFILRVRGGHFVSGATIPSVSVVKPEMRPLDSNTSLPANMEAIEQASLYAHVSGYLKKIYVDEGDKVKKGQLLAEIDAPDVIEDYNKYKAELGLKTVTLKRYQELLNENVISQQEFDTIDAAYGESKALFDSAAATMEYTHIRAPFSGSIARRFKYPGDLITVSSGKEDQSPIFLLVNEAILRIVVNVPQIEVGHIKVGDPVDINVDTFPDKPFKGVISRLDALFDETTKTQRVLIDIDNSDGKLRAGMFASVVLHFEHIDKALTIPREVVETEGGEKTFVYILKDGKVKKVFVSLGLQQDEIVQVISGGGLTPDDLVIKKGMLNLTEGAAVKPVKEN